MRNKDGCAEAWECRGDGPDRYPGGMCGPHRAKEREKVTLDECAGPSLALAGVDVEGDAHSPPLRGTCRRQVSNVSCAWDRGLGWKQAGSQHRGEQLKPWIVIELQGKYEQEKEEGPTPKTWGVWIHL